MKVYFGPDAVWKHKGDYSRSQQRIETLSDALAVQSDCGACGCNECYGLWTNINATNGELMGMYITGTDPYTLVIEPYATALANVKALKAVRDAS